MRIKEVDTNISTINKFLLSFKEKICSSISIKNSSDNIISWILIFNNRNSFNTSKCYAKTESGNQCKRSKGYCDSIFCGLHYSGKGAHIRKRNETILRFYEKENQTILTYKLVFTTIIQDIFDFNNLSSIYIKNKKYYLDSRNGDVYNIDDVYNGYTKIGNINTDIF